MSLDAMKQALEALEFLALENFVELDKSLNVGPTHGRKAIIALRAAIEQAEKHDPVAWMYVNTDGECEQIEYLKNEPMPDDPSVTRLYAAPRQWQGLTDEEIDELALDENGLPNSHIEFARAIEARLKEKNT